MLDVGSVLEFLCRRSLHSALEARYDLPSARIVVMLLGKRYLEQKDIAEKAMMPAKVRIECVVLYYYLTPVCVCVYIEIFFLFSSRLLYNNVMDGY